MIVLGHSEEEKRRSHNEQEKKGRVKVSQIERTEGEKESGQSVRSL